MSYKNNEGMRLEEVKKLERKVKHGGGDGEAAQRARGAFAGHAPHERGIDRAQQRHRDVGQDQGRGQPPHPAVPLAVGGQRGGGGGGRPVYLRRILYRARARRYGARPGNRDGSAGFWLRWRAGAHSKRS